MWRCRTILRILPQHHMYNCKRYTRNDFVDSPELTSASSIIKDTLLKCVILLGIMAFGNLLFRGSFTGNYTDEEDIIIPIKWQKAPEPNTEGFVDESGSAEQNNSPQFQEVKDILAKIASKSRS